MSNHWGSYYEEGGRLELNFDEEEWLDDEPDYTGLRDFEEFGDDWVEGLDDLVVEPYEDDPVSEEEDSI